MAGSLIDKTLDVSTAVQGGIEQPIDNEEVEIELTPEDLETYADLFNDESLAAMSDVPPSDMPLEAHDSNLAEFMDEAELSTLASELIELYNTDKESREEWESIAERAVELLGFKLDEEADGPFEGASNVTHPLLAQAVVKFQSKAFKELYPAKGPVRTKIMGNQTTQRLQQAKRVADFMNYQTTCVMTEYGPELDRLLFQLALFGSAFKKTYYDFALGRPVSVFVKPQDFVINYYATDIETAQRYTHRMVMHKNEVRRLMNAGIFRKLDLGEAPAPELDSIDDLADDMQGRSQPSLDSDQYTILEMYVTMDLPGYESNNALPYIITIEQETEEVLAIRRNWDEADIDQKPESYFTHYYFIPGLGFYGYGYMHLIGGLAKSATSSIRQLIDAGTFANLPAGFKAHGFRVVAPDEPLQPGEWRDVNAPAGDISKALLPLPFKEPSPTLMKLLDYTVSQGKEFADATDQMLEDATNYGPVGTTLALIEQSTKLYSAIHKRLHAAQTNDLRILARLDGKFLPDNYPYELPNGQTTVFRQDFDLNIISVIPVSDPNMPTEAHRLARLQTIMQNAQAFPQLHNIQSVLLDFYTELGVDQPERYMAQGQQPISADPVTEIAAAMRGMPIAANHSQNHDAHIRVKAAVLQNPAYAGNQQMAQILLANINEHLSLKFQMEMAQLSGDPQIAQLMLSGQPLPPEIQNQIAFIAAENIDKLTQLDTVKAEIMEGTYKDPAMELAEREVQIKENKNSIDLLKVILADKNRASDLQLKEAKIMLEDLNRDLDREVQIRNNRNRGPN